MPIFSGPSSERAPNSCGISTVNVAAERQNIILCEQTGSSTVILLAIENGLISSAMVNGLGSIRENVVYPLIVDLLAGFV
jgi:hypothetical protein